MIPSNQPVFLICFASKSPLAYLSTLAKDRVGPYNGEVSEKMLRRMIEAGKQDPQVQPNFVTYSTVMNAWARAAQPARAAAVLRAMYDDYVNGNEQAKPDVQSFNTVLKAYSRSTYANVPEEAEAFFCQMQSMADKGVLDIEPDTFTYSAGKLVVRDFALPFPLSIVSPLTPYNHPYL